MRATAFDLVGHLNTIRVAHARGEGGTHDLIALQSVQTYISHIIECSRDSRDTLKTTQSPFRRQIHTMP